jgi:hypothetical protein
MAFCGECGVENGGTKFCVSCGSEISSIETSASSKPRGNIRRDPKLMCPKCGENECYTGKNSKPNELVAFEDFCSVCDLPMVPSELGIRENRRFALWSVVGGLGIGGVLLFWIFGGNDDQESEQVANSSTSQSQESSAPENAISDTDCSYLTADLGVVNEMFQIGEEYGMTMAMRMVHQNANLYAERYSGEVNHDLQVLADRALETVEWFEGERGTDPPDVATAFETVMAHCGIN